MTRLLKQYYDIRAYYREKAKQNPNRTPNERAQSCRELGQKIGELLSQMDEGELLYLKERSSGMSRWQYDIYLKKLQERKEASAPAYRPHDETVATAV
jgi:hypothetical protein